MSHRVLEPAGWGGAEVVHDPCDWAPGSWNISLGGRPLQFSSPFVSAEAVLRFDDGDRYTQQQGVALCSARTLSSEGHLAIGANNAKKYKRLLLRILHLV